MVAQGTKLMLFGEGSSIKVKKYINESGEGGQIPICRHPFDGKGPWNPDGFRFEGGRG